MSRSLFAAVALCFLLPACGGTKQEAKAPTTDAADAPRDGSSAPDPTPTDIPSTDPPKADPPKPAVASSTDDGSDIIPPFTASGSKEPVTAAKDPAEKKASSGKASKKKKGKKKTARAS